MIPRHRPAFGLAGLARAMLRRPRRIEAIEEAYASACGVDAAVWVPSVRAGIGWALKEVLRPGAPVLCPVLTCMVVHEGVVRSGGSLRLVDTRPDEFLADEAALAVPGPEGYAVVLPELYGHPYDLARLSRQAAAPPRLRVVDAAMSLPVPGPFGRLTGNDVALISFGLGKSMYAGWGGIGLTRDSALAVALRGRRDAALHPAGPRLAARRAVTVLARTVAHNRFIYGPMRKLRLRTFRGQAYPVSQTTGFPRKWVDEQNCDPEWFLPSTWVDRALMVHNLLRTEAYAARRRLLAERYRQRLAGAEGVALPPPCAFPLSHFTVCVAAPARRGIREGLWQKGIDAAMLYEFPTYASKAKFPNALKVAQRLLNLPLNVTMTLRDVDCVCETLLRCLKACRPAGPAQDDGT